MSQILYFLTLVCLVAILRLSECRHIVKRGAALHPMDPHVLKELTKQSIYRDKRKVDIVTNVKNSVLGFVFNVPSASKGFAWEIPKTPKPPIKTTTEDAVQFTPGQPVSLQIPDKLFGSSFTLVTNLSNTVGDYMINSALRAQRLLESIRPFLRTIFGAGGIVIEATTNKPIFSDANTV